MRISAKQKEVIKRCQASVVWFLKNFGKLKHPSAGIIPFTPFSYQRRAIEAFRRFRLNIFRKCRQAGASKIAGAFALWFAMFNNHKTILIVSRRDEDAMSFLREQIVFLYEHLPEWMKEVWKPVKQNEHELAFPNGSRIASLTSHPDVLRSNASSLNIIDEAAFIQGMDAMWAGGWPCATGDTLVQTNDGLFRLDELCEGGDPWKSHEVFVATDEGYKLSNKAFVSGHQPIIELTTEFGFNLKAANHHKVRTIDDSGDYSWKMMADLKPNDIIISKPDVFKGRRRLLTNGAELSPDLAEILGLYIGDGYLSTSRPKRLKIAFDPQDVSTRNLMVDKLNRLNLGISTEAYAETEYDTENLRLNSHKFIQLMCENDLNSKTVAQDATIPKLILQSDEEVLCAFLRGLFDSDGWCYQSSTSLKLGFSTSSERLSEEVQIALHSLGIISKRYMVDTEKTPDKNEQRYNDKPYWRVDVWDAASKLAFRSKIGFITERKQKCLDSFKSDSESAELDHPILVGEFASLVLDAMKKGSSFRDCGDARKWNILRIKRFGRVSISLIKNFAAEFNINNRLTSLVKMGLFFDRVKLLSSSSADTYDLSVPDNNTYLANGLVSHNTLQHGGNVIVISTCVVPSTYVFTSAGLSQIGDFDNDVYGFSDYDGPDILGIDGLNQPSKFYKREAEKTKVIKSDAGYELEATHKHRIWVCRSGECAGWAFMDELQIGDYLPIVRGRNVFGHDDHLGFTDGPDTYHASSLNIDKIDEDLAYLLGVILAKGYISDTYVTVASGDDEVINRFLDNKLGIKWIRESRETHIRCGSTRFVRFLKWFGFSKQIASYKTLPRRLWTCSRNIFTAFIRGMYDGDGHSRSTNGEVGYTSTSRELIKQLRVVLCNYGIICREEYHKAYQKKFTLNERDYVSECKESWQLIIRSGEAVKFYDMIGFGLDRKMVNKNAIKISKDYIPNIRYWLGKLRKSTGLSLSDLKQRGINAPSLLLKRHKRDLTDRKVVDHLLNVLSDFSDNDAYKMIRSMSDPMIYWDCIKAIDDGYSETVDFAIEADPTFWTNGIMSHNTNGVGNWYWATMTEAEAGINQFNPIVINWYDMDWEIEYDDPISREHKRIAPRDGLRKCTTKEEIMRYGPYVSPWLELQYRALQAKGESWKFEQEILASFIGSGNTVLPKEVLAHMTTTVCEPEQRVTGMQTYVHPVSGEAQDMTFDFDDESEGLWVWKKPVNALPEKRRGSEIIQYSAPAHPYVMGIDIATGKGKDYHAIEVFDVYTREQVAEFMARCLPRELVYYIDRIGRYYNCALAVVERNNGGDIIIDELRYNVMYPRIWRKKEINDKPQPAASRGKRKARALKVATYGFATTQASKPTLNQFMLNYLRDNSDDGYTIYSNRLLKQFHTYVRKRDRLGHDTSRTEAEEGAGNHDDLVIASALALLGTADSFVVDAGNLTPYGANATSNFKSQAGPTILSDDQSVQMQQDYTGKGGAHMLMPMTRAPDDFPEVAAQRVLDAYTVQLGGIPISQGKPLVTPSKFFYEKQK